MVPSYKEELTSRALQSNNRSLRLFSYDPSEAAEKGNSWLTVPS
jgi:hypothetical protein